MTGSYRKYINSKIIKFAARGSALLAALLAASFFVKADPAAFLRGLPSMGELLLRVLKPNFQYVKEIVPALLETLEIAAVSSFLGAIAALPLSMLISRRTGMAPQVSRFFSALFSMLRTVPSLIWAAILVTMFSVGKFSGMMAIFIIAALMGVRLMREQIDSIDENRINSLRSVGASRVQILLKCIIPMAQARLISVFFIIFESNLRSATVLGLVGAGGIGQLMWKDLNMFRYDNISTIIFALFLMIYAMDWLSFKMRKLSGVNLVKVKTYRAYRIKKVSLKIIKPVLVAGAVLFVASQLGIGSDRFRLGLKQGAYIIGNIFKPDFSYSYKLYDGLKESLSIAVFASIAGGALSYVLVGLSAQNVQKNAFVSWFFKAITNVFRTFPPIITAIIFFRGVGPGPFAGALALSVYTAGVLSKMFTEMVESESHAKVEALESTGSGRLGIYMRGLFPENAAGFFSLLLFRMESNIRNSTILGLVGAGGIGTALNMNIQWRNWNRVGLLLLGAGSMIIVVDIMSRYVRKRLDR